MTGDMSVLVASGRNDFGAGINSKGKTDGSRSYNTRYVCLAV